MNNNPTYQQPLCSPCATCDESNTTTTRKQDDNETKTTANDAVRCVPQKRFPEFLNAGEWNMVLLGAIVDYENGAAHEQYIDVNGKYILVNSKFISSNGQIEKRTDTLHCLAQKGDVLMVLSDLPNGRALAKCFYVQENDKYAVNQRICKLHPHGIYSKFLYYLLDRNEYFLSFDDGVKQTNLKKDEVLQCPLIIPKTIEEQKYIADSLDAINGIIISVRRTTEQLKSHKNALLQILFPQRGRIYPECHFNNFQNAEMWEETIVENAIKTITPPKKLQSKEYRTTGAIPIIDQSQAYICGYSDDETAILNKDSQELIIFGDHTCILKLVDFPFIQGSDGIKIFKSKNKKRLDTKFLYYMIQCLHIEPIAYKRHFSELRSKKILFPSSLNEQQKIAACLQSIDNEIFATMKKLELLQMQKNALMQQLFIKYKLSWT